MNHTFEQELDETGWLVFQNAGTSMMPLLRQNRDVFVIRKKGGERCKKYDAVLYKRGGRYVLHRVLAVRERDYVICGDNCFQKEYGITDADILGTMTEVVRDGKSIPVTDRRYLCYVHLWCDFFWIRAALLRLRSLLGRVKRYFQNVKARKGS